MSLATNSVNFFWVSGFLFSPTAVLTVLMVILVASSIRNGLCEVERDFCKGDCKRSWSHDLIQFKYYCLK